MFDWIVVSKICQYTVTPSIIVTVFALSIYLCGRDIVDDIEEWGKGVWKAGTRCVAITIVASLLTAISSLPSIVIEANIDRVKIHYTSPQSIAKIESGALEVVNKLDKLIDKGINRLERDNDKQ